MLHKENYTVTVVIPAFNPDRRLVEVISRISQKVKNIIVVDDASYKSSVKQIISEINDARIHLIKHERNEGVGGAMQSGYMLALQLESDVVVKIDADGQMKPEIIDDFVFPIVFEGYDYTKGNRFHSLSSLKGMPKYRLIGNSALSIMSKFSSGYWATLDPTNGYTAISGEKLKQLTTQKIDKRYFFESDMLYHLNLLDSKILDVPMNAHYDGENSNLNILKTIFEFPYKHLKNFFKRVFFIYFVRDFNIASLQLIFGFSLFMFGITTGVIKFFDSASKNISTPTGTLILISISLLAGVQLISNFLTYDVQRLSVIRPLGGHN